MSDKTNTPPGLAKEREEVLASMDKNAEENIKTWNDLYDMLTAQVSGYFSDVSRPRAEFSLALLNSFVLALKDLPEEGDALVIAKRMHHILIMETDRTGLYIAMPSEVPPAPAPAPDTLAQSLRAILGALVQDQQAEDALGASDPAVAGTEKKRTLH